MEMPRLQGRNLSCLRPVKSSAKQREWLDGCRVLGGPCSPGEALDPTPCCFVRVNCPAVRVPHTSAKEYRREGILHR